MFIKTIILFFAILISYKTVLSVENKGQQHPKNIIEVLRETKALFDQPNNLKKLSFNKQIIALLSKYNLFLLQKKYEDAQKAFSQAFELNNKITDPYEWGCNFLELGTTAELNPFLMDKLNWRGILNDLIQDERAKIFADNRAQNREIECPRESLLQDLQNHITSLYNPLEKLYFGRIADSFIRLHEKHISRYDLKNIRPEQLLELADHTNWLLMFERLFLQMYSVILSVNRDIDLQPFEHIIDIPKKTFEYLTPISKHDMLDLTVFQAERSMELGDYYIAAYLFKLCQTLLASSEQPFEKRGFFEARIYLQQGFLNTQLGQIFPASNLLKIALEKIQNVTEIDDKNELLGFYHRYKAQIFLLANEKQNAIDNYTKSIEAFTKINHPDAIGGWGQLAQVYILENDYIKALNFANEGLEFRKKLDDLYKSELLDHKVTPCHLSIVRSYYFLKEYSKMKEALNNAYSVVYTPRGLASLHIYEGLRDIEIGNGCSMAIFKFKQALQLLSEKEQSQLTELANLKIGKCYDELGKPEEALPFFEKAIIINRNLRKVARGSLAYNINRGPFDEIQQQLHKIIFDLLIETNFKSKDLGQKLLYFAELAKSRGLVDEIESMRRGISWISPAVTEEEIKVLRDLFPIYPTRDLPKVETSNIFDEYQKFVTEIEQRHGRSVVILEYIPILQRDRVVLYVIEHNSVTMVLLKTSWLSIKKSTQEFLQYIALSLEKYTQLRNSPRPDVRVIQRIKRLENEINRKSTEIGQILFPEAIPNIGTLCEKIRGKSLILVPHGILHNLPFVALKLTNEESGYLIDIVDRIASIPSSMVLQSIISYYTSNLEKNVTNVLLVGDPDNPELPAVEAEFNAIKAVCDSVTITSEKQNIKSFFNKHAAVHFGAHAFFNRSDPAVSGLILKDGILSLAEIVMLEAFHTRLVTMGACETGEADISSIGDEVWSIATGFMNAGIPGIIGSLWMQDGDASYIFFKNFYHFLSEKDDVGSAFRKAMNKVRRSEHLQDITSTSEIMNFASPCFWAGFNFLGE